MMIYECIKLIFNDKPLNTKNDTAECKVMKILNVILRIYNYLQFVWNDCLAIVGGQLSYVTP